LLAFPGLLALLLDRLTRRLEVMPVPEVVACLTVDPQTGLNEALGVLRSSTESRENIGRHVAISQLLSAP
jgi:hypothetical protein